ncbi:odorant receptor Or2-like isoform X2 [Phymastichus coffea]|uniref:odorant receptor Or2-like isoform X2 n=1 Tax=Phymastichus coffea TaxID=108790 RepID=UPI00273B3F8F|nr:odorant receptor Or2-like isoform X2 [Phymastichus coffea]
MPQSSESEERAPSFDELTALYKRFLRLFALLPLEGRDFSGAVSRLILVYCLAWSSVYWSMMVFYVASLSGAPTVDAICETVVVVGVSLRYYLLLLRRSELVALMDESRAIWEACGGGGGEGRRAVHRFERKVRRLFKLLLGSCCFTILMFSASAASATRHSAAAANGTEHARFLPFKWYSERGPDLWPGYGLNFALQLLVTQSAGMAAATVDSTGAFLLMLGAGYFRALRRRLLRAADRPASADSELLACVRLHQRVLGLCSRTDKLTGGLFFVQLLCTGYNLSLIGIKLAGTDPDRFKFVPLLLASLSALFICQWAADHLIQESTAISTAAYSVSLPWMGRRMGKLLVLVIARSQRPVQMTAAGVVHLSIENFGSMLTSAVSFFTVLRSFNL